MTVIGPRDPYASQKRWQVGDEYKPTISFSEKEEKRCMRTGEILGTKPNHWCVPVPSRSGALGPDIPAIKMREQSHFVVTHWGVFG